MSVNSRMFALDEKKAGIGIAAFCLMLPPESIWIPKPTPEEKLLFQLLQCHLPFHCALTLSFLLFFCLTPSHNFFLNLLNLLSCTV